MKPSQLKYTSEHCPLGSVSSPSSVPAPTADNKKCSKCKEIYPATVKYFTRDKNCKDGLKQRCKQCRKQYRQQHREKNNQCHKRYQQKHRKELNEYKKKYHNTIIGYIRRLWNNITQRCNNSKSRGFKYYGGRGIKVKFASFNNFYDYVLNELKADPRGLTIDRINNDGNYEKGNIRFVTRAENNRNKGRRRVRNAEIKR